MEQPFNRHAAGVTFSLVDPTRVTIELSGELRQQQPGVIAGLLAQRLGEQVDLAVSLRPVYRGLSGTEEPA